MPPLQAVGWPRDPLWRAILARLVDEVARTPGTPAEAAEVCAALRRAVDEDPEALEDLAEAVLAEQDHGVDGAAAPFVMAALQVYWTSLASRFDEKQLPVTSPSASVRSAPACRWPASCAWAASSRATATCAAACARPSGTWCA